MKLFDLHTGTLLSAVGRKGEGPDEFQSVGSLQLFRHGDGQLVAAVFDASLQRLVEFALAGDTLHGQRSMISVAPAGSYLQVVWVNDTTLAALGAFKQTRFDLLNRSGTLRRSLGVVPGVTAQVPATVAHQVLQPTVTVEPGGRHIAIGVRYAGRVDIYSTIDGSLQPAAVPDPFEPVITVTSNGAMAVFATNQQTRFGYVWMASNDREIYALFSGRTRQNAPGRAYAGSAVHVFGWDGKLKRVIEVDRDLVSIAIDATGRSLYGVATDPEPAVVVYLLK